MNNFLNKIKKQLNGNFSKGVLFISSGTTLGQAIAILSTPIITRMYSPTEYGVLSVYTAALSIFALGALSYEQAIPILKEKEDVFNLVVLCQMILILYIMLIYFGLFIFGDGILEFLDMKELIPYKLYLPVGVFFNSLFLIFRQWPLKTKRYSELSIATINQHLVGNSTKIGLGLIGFGSIGLIVGRIFTYFAGSLNLVWSFYNQYKNNFFNLLNYEKIKSLLLKFYKFPVFRMPTIFLQKATQQIPILFLTSIYGVTVSGWYGLAHSITMLPMTIIGDSISDVFYSEAASYGIEQSMYIKKLSNKLVKRLAILGFLPTILLALFAPEIFELIFGQEWRTTGVFVRILSLSLYLRIVLVPVSRIYEIYEKQNIKLLISIIQTFFVILSFMVVSFFEYTPEISILIYSIIITLFFIIDFLIAQHIINKKINVM